MNPNLSPLNKFKHDTIGKFQNLKELIEYINENNINDPESKEILTEVKNTFQKMAAAVDQILKKQ